MRSLAPFVLLVLRTACGETRLDRGASGAAIGAGAGAAAGVLTDQDDVDLGDPVWRR
jgi:hypothetical protein